MRFDGLPALVELLVEPLAPGDRLGVQLGLQPGLPLGLLLEQPLGLRACLAQLALGVRTQLVRLDLRIAQQLLGLMTDVVVGRAGREVAARLMELGAQHLDLVAEVVGVLNGLVPLALQPLHLGLELREVVVSLVAVVAPHCAVPSVPWSWWRPSPVLRRSSRTRHVVPDSRPSELTLPKKWCQIIGRVWTEPHSRTPAEAALYRPGKVKVSGLRRWRAPR